MCFDKIYLIYPPPPPPPTFWAPSQTLDWINTTCLLSELLAISLMPQTSFDDNCMLHIYNLGIFD